MIYRAVLNRLRAAPQPDFLSLHTQTFSLHTPDCLVALSVHSYQYVFPPSTLCPGMLRMVQMFQHNYSTLKID